MFQPSNGLSGYKPELVASATVSGSQFVLTPANAFGQTDALIKVMTRLRNTAAEVYFARVDVYK